MAGEIFYPPPPVVFRQVKVIPLSPIDSPLPSRRGILNQIRAAWDVPHVAAISKQSLRQYYQPKWDVPDDPPLVDLSNLFRIIAQHYEIDESTLRNITLELIRRKKRFNSALLPTRDNPPRWQLPRILEQTLLSHYQELASQFRLPLNPNKLSNWLYLPAPTPINLGYIAFQPNAFQVGYPRSAMGFQGANRYVQVQSLTTQRLFNIKIMYLQVGKRMDEYQRGDTAVIGCRVYDPSVEPQVLKTPELATIVLYNPDGTVRLNNTILTVISEGTLVYKHQIAVDDQIGIYTGRITVSNFGNTAISQKQAFFKVVDN